MGKIIIKQRSHPDNDKLPAKYVGSKEYATPKVGKDGKIITGVDENAYAILNSDLPEKDKKKKQDEMLKLREALQSRLSVDLSVDSDYWNKFFIVLDEDRELDSQNALDQLHEKFLLANRYVAPSFEEMEENPDYLSCLFYIYREAEDTVKKATTEKKKDAAIATLFTLEQKEPVKLKSIAGHIFGIDSVDMSVEAAYIKIKEFLEVTEPRARKENIERFMAVANMTTEEMQIKRVLDKAISKKLITTKGGIYRRDEEVYGHSYEEALDFLNSPENSGELADLRKVIRVK